MVQGVEASDLDFSVSKVKRLMREASDFDRISQDAANRMSVYLEAVVREKMRKVDKVAESKDVKTIMADDVQLIIDLEDL